MKKTHIVSVMFLLFGCQQAASPAQSNDAESQPASTAPPAPAPAGVPPTAQAPAGLPDDRTPLAEPQGAIDPKSAEAAGQVVQHYGALIEQGRWSESWTLWANPGAARQFDRNWRNDRDVHIEIGKPGDMEGAAGSSYVTVPVVFYGTTKAGGSFRRRGDAILRRVNDVPGSTEAQRRWRIERIEWAGR